MLKRKRLIALIVVSILTISYALPHPHLWIGSKGNSMSSLERLSVYAESPWQIHDLEGMTKEEKAEQLVESLIGSGLAVNNPRFIGTETSGGWFQTASNIIGFNSGIILSTGSIHNVVGPNTSEGISENNDLPGDTDLESLISGTTYDATVLEFDFVPTSNELYFEYVFSSDEYNEFVNSTFNDVFAFFVNGKNVATVPGTDTPVSINNVNKGNPIGTDASHPEYFINNDLESGAPINTEMDGLTVVLPIRAKVNPGEYNSIKLAIADVGDSILDSNVFIRTGSFIGQVDKMTGFDAVSNIRNKGINFPIGSIGVPVSDPVDSATGAQVMNHTMLEVAGAIPLSFDLIYNSLLLDEGMMGKGWTNNYEISIEEFMDGRVVVNWTSNRRNTFIPQGETYTSPDLAMEGYTLEKLEDGGFEIITSQKEKYQFNESGALVSLMNQDNREIKLSYHGENLESVIEPIGGQKLMFYYSETGLLEKAEDLAGREVHFIYDDEKRLVEKINANGSATTFTYNNDHQILSAVDHEDNIIFSNTFDEEGRVIQQADSKGNTGQFSYEENYEEGRLVTTYVDLENNTNIFEYNNLYQLVRYTDGEGYNTYMEYDGIGNLLQEKDEQGVIREYSYDDRHNLVSTQDALGRVTYFSYDERDNLTAITDALGNITTYTYDENDRIIEMKDPLGGKEIFRYDEKGFLHQHQSEALLREYLYEMGRLIEIIENDRTDYRYSYDEVGRMKDLTIGEEYTFHFEYDLLDNLTGIKDPEGHMEFYEFDDFGRLRKSINGRGYETLYEYDTNHNLIGITDALGHKTRIAYDKENRPVKITDARNGERTLEYGGRGNAIAIVSPMGNRTEFTYDQRGNLTGIRDAYGNESMSILYDEAGNAIRITNTAGNSFEMEYNPLNQIVRTLDFGGSESFFEYDEINRMIKTVDPAGNVMQRIYDEEKSQVRTIDGHHHELMLNYNTGGNLEALQVDGQGAKQYIYDKNGLLTKFINGRDQESNYEYDKNLRLVSMIEDGRTTEMKYDENGNVLEIKDPEGTMTYKYDALDQMIEFTDIFGDSIIYEYDEVGNLIMMGYPGGKTVHYEYDLENKLTRVEDWAGRITTYAYDRNGNQVEMIRPNNSIETRTYDSMGQLIEVRDVNSKGDLINHYFYQYDDNGNITEEKNAVSFDFSFSTETIASSYGSGNQILNHGESTIIHDLDGNLIEIDREGIKDTYAYDSRNRLTSFNDTEYSYNAHDHRIKKNNDGQEIRYTVSHNGSLPIVIQEEVESEGNRYYLYGNGLIGLEDEEGNYISYHFDYRGSTTALTGENGEVNARYMYDPFGSIIGKQGSIDQPYQYIGQMGVETDRNGLVYMRARYYNPEMQRFINQDVHLGDIIFSQSVNRYAYSFNNPVMYIDPDGEWPFPVVAGGVAAVGSLTAQLVSDGIRSVQQREVVVSDWQTYAGAAAGGFVGGAMLSSGVNPTIAYASAATVSNAVKQVGYATTGSQDVNLRIRDNAVDVGIDTVKKRVSYSISQKLNIPDSIKKVPSQESINSSIKSSIPIKDSIKASGLFNLSVTEIKTKKATYILDKGAFIAGSAVSSISDAIFDYTIPNLSKFTSNSFSQSSNKNALVLNRQNKVLAK